MNAAEVVVILWLVLLSVAVGFGIYHIRQATRLFREGLQENARRSRQLDIEQGLADVLDLLKTRDLRTDRDLLRCTNTLIESLDADPAAKEKHWIAINALKQRLH